MKRILLLTAMFWFAIPLLAQTPPGTSTSTLQVSVGASALGLSGNNNAEAGTDVLATAVIWKSLTLRSDNILVPATSAAIFTGSVQYPFSNLLAKTNFPELEPYLTCGAGVNRLSPAGAAAYTNLAVLCGGGLNYTPTGGVKVNLFEIRWLHSQVPVGSPFPRNAPVIAGGIQMFWGNPTTATIQEKRAARRARKKAEREEDRLQRQAAESSSVPKGTSSFRR